MKNTSMQLVEIHAGGPSAYAVDGVWIFVVGGLHARDAVESVNQELKEAGLLGVVVAEAKFACIILIDEYEKYSQSNRVIFDHLRQKHNHCIGFIGRQFVAFPKRRSKGVLRRVINLGRVISRSLRRRFR